MIIYFLEEMLFYMTISLPIIIFFRYFFRDKSKLLDKKREFFIILFFVFLIGLASQTIMPNLSFEDGVKIIPQAGTGLNLKPFLVISQTKYEVFVRGNLNYFLINFVGNILIFIPIGFFLPFLWKRKFFSTVFIGFLISLLIETVQLFISRGTDVDDLWLNTLGALLGYIVFKIFSKKKS